MFAGRGREISRELYGTFRTMVWPVRLGTAVGSIAGAVAADFCVDGGDILFSAP